jgi:molybdopterin synthase sulfur carrier subunit
LKVRVRLFAALREVVGQDALDLELEPGTTVEALWARLVEGNDRLDAYGKSINFAVNHDFVGRDTELSPDDEVAFLPPVSGG